MHPLDIIAILIFAFVVLPITAYLVVKFGTVGYYKAKRFGRDSEETRTDRKK